MDKYKYFRLGSKLSKHLVFEISSIGDMMIFTAIGDARYDKFRLSEEDKIYLKKWINQNM